MMHFTSKPAAALALVMALGSSLGIAQAATPATSIWTPTVYSLGGPSLIPVYISTRLDTDDGEEDVVVTGQRAPRSTIGSPDLSSPQSVFNIGGDPLVRPADCTQEYTTTGGQPASATDLTGAAGIRGCYY